MKIIEVPIFNEDGSVKITQVLTPEQVQPLLQFALSFLTATGLSVTKVVAPAEPPKDVTVQ